MSAERSEEVSIRTGNDLRWGCCRIHSRTLFAEVNRFETAYAFAELDGAQSFHVLPAGGAKG